MKKQKRRKMIEGLNSSPLKRKTGRLVEEPGEDIGSKSVPAARRILDKPLPNQRVHDDLLAQLEKLKQEISDLEYEARRSEKPQEFPPPSDEYLANLRYGKKLRLFPLADTNIHSRALLTAEELSPSALGRDEHSPPPVSSLLSFLLPFSVPKFLPTIEPEPPPSPIPPNPFALDQLGDPIPFLTLFAPMSFAARTSTVAASTIGDFVAPGKSFVQKHDLTLSPPHDFPASLCRVLITVYTDPDEHSVIYLSANDSADSKSGQAHSPSVPEPLRRWINNRLSNPLLKLDVSGLCWGICRYWEAAISRASFWLYLEDLLPAVRQGASSKHSNVRERTSVPQQLSAHFNRTSFLLSVPGNSQHVQVLVTCLLNLDIWTGEPELQPDVCIKGSQSGRDRVEQEVKKVFLSILKRPGNIDDSIVGAVETVAAAIFDMD
jgi:hypothetical protein